MRILLFLFVFSLSNAQQLEVKKIEEETRSTFNSVTKKEFFVLKQKESVRHGLYKEFVDGQKVVKGFYKEGKKDSTWLYESPNKWYSQRGNYKNGKRVGVWTYKKGTLCYGRSYFNKNGEKDSAFSYNGNDKLLMSYRFDSISKTGLLIEEFENGFVKKTESKKSLEIKSFYYPNKQLFYTKITDGYLVKSITPYYNKEGIIIKNTKFKNGTGVMYCYDTDKLLDNKYQILEAVEYKKGMMDGFYFAKNKKGLTRIKGSLKKGYRIGKWELWDRRSGQLVEKKYSFKEKELKQSNLNEEAYLLKNISTTKLMADEFFEMKANVSKNLSKSIQKIINTHLDVKELAAYIIGNEIVNITVVFNFNFLGEVKDLNIKVPYEGMEKIVKKAIDKFPTIIPASQNGRLVNSVYAFPIKLKFN